MTRFHRLTALTATGALLAVPVALIATPAHADVDRFGTCGGGQYEFSVDRENRGYEASVDLDNIEPGSKWRVVLRHDGKRFFKRTLIADNEGDLDVDSFRRNSSGRDTFKFRAVRLDGSASCGRTLTVS